MKDKYEVLLLDYKKDKDILFDIANYEIEIFGEASIGHFNIGPMTKYGRVYVILDENKKQSEAIVSVVEVMSSFNKKQAYIYGASTSKNYQNKGYAKKILNYVIKDLENIGIDKIELTVGVENKIAVHLYKSLGFIEKEFLENEYDDNIERYLLELNIRKEG